MTDVSRDSGELFPTTQGFDGDIIAPEGAVTGATGDSLEPLGESGVAVESTLEAGLQLKVRSQWSYARMRFFRHRLAMAGLLGLVIIFGAGILAPYIAPYSFAYIPLFNPHYL